MKIKKWNITVIDNPNIATISESDEFYTTDTEAFLVFELKDKNFNPTRATITLHNRTDGSAVNEDVDVIDGTIAYEMREEVIEHAGGWQAQLVYEQDKDGVPEKYTSKVVKFNVSGHLLDTKEPALVVIENWNNFVLTAEGTMEQWESLEAIRQENENQRVAAETARQSAENAREETFATNETDRQSTFETNEDARQETFENNETARQSAEGNRETAENRRQTDEATRKTSEISREEEESTRNSNENQRASNEDTRKNNEVKRIDNEDGRATAESNREENEKTRIDNEADRTNSENTRNANENNRIANDTTREMKYNELVDTGIMQENINEKLSESEQTYAPRLTNLEQNDANLTAQLAQTVDDVNRAASELTQDSEVILARGSYDYLGERFEDVDRRLTAQSVVMGVEWDKQEDPTLTRIGGSKDFVANIGIGDEVVQNDFDYAPIYREIQREVDMYGNVFVRIPRFYIRKTVTDSLKRIEISTEKLKNFYLPIIFYDFENQKELPYAHIGAYNAGISLDGTKLESKAGVKPLVSRNIVDFRNLAQANGVGYQQLDIHAVDVIQTLFYVEFATLQSQSIHPGYTSGNTESLASGFSDGIVASSGALSMSETDGFMYRGIENPWGNVNQWVDGVNILDHQAWVCKDAENYASNVFVAPYEKLGYVNHTENGLIKGMGFDPAHPYAEFPVEVGGSYTTYYADNYYQSTGRLVALFGGGWARGSFAGLSYWNLDNESSKAYSNSGCRLLKKSL